MASATAAPKIKQEDRRKGVIFGFAVPLRDRKKENFPFLSFSCLVLAGVSY